MTSMQPLERVIEDTPASAADIDWNFQTIEGHIATELINRDGSVAMTAPLSGPDAVNPTEYATLQQTQVTVPTGSMTVWAGPRAAIPAGWALCDGAQHSVGEADFTALYNAIGVTYGGSVGVSFNLPNLAQRIPVGQDAGVTGFATVGNTGGSIDSALLEHNHAMSHTHETASHTHTVNPPSTESNNRTHTHTTPASSLSAPFVTVTSSGGSTLATGGNFEGGAKFQRSAATDYTHNHDVNIASFSSGSAGGGSTFGQSRVNTDPAGDPAGAGSNLQPYVVMNWIIKL